MEELPLGFGMALAQNPRAMEYFTKQTKEKQAEIVAHTHTIQSRNEMHAYVQSLGSFYTGKRIHTQRRGVEWHLSISPEALRRTYVRAIM